MQHAEVRSSAKNEEEAKSNFGGNFLDMFIEQKAKLI